MKPSWTEVASLTALLFFAAVMANGWPELSVDLWVALGAIGSTSAAVVAATLGAGSWTRQKKRDAEIANSLGWLVIPWIGTVRAGADQAALLLENLIDIPPGERPSEMDRFQARLIVDMLAVDRFSPFFIHLHALEERYPRLSEAISASWRLHDALSALDLEKPLPSNRCLLESLLGSAKYLSNLTQAIARRAGGSSKSTSQSTAPPT